MSLTSYRAAPPRVGYGWVSCCVRLWAIEWVGWKPWRRPTLPRLKTQYHGRWGFSRPSSGWDRVGGPRHGHQVIQPTPWFRPRLIVGRETPWRGALQVLAWILR